MTVAALSSALGASGDDSSARFSRDIRPLLSENCFACHGPDTRARKANLRLDTKEGLYERTPKRGPAVVPGDLEKSALWHRITTTDADDRMPPAESNKALTAQQKELIKEWILGGASWQGHWAFIKPERPPVPQVKSSPGFKVRNPIDAFILARLQAKGLKPAPEADRRTLARRLALDLTGLPPQPDTVNAFLSDASAAFYLRRVKQLMASPQWGEHRARYWLDAARYADTHGLHFDNYREIWPYRDWVIRAFNRNLSFDQFTIEQLAGDLLDHATDDDRVATGFHRCNMTTNEGGTIEDENLANYANDRVTTTSWVWLGVTLNCCACHDHKFDPFTTRDFYSLAAIFRNTKQGGFDKNRRESDLYMVVPGTAPDQARWKVLPAEIELARKDRDAQQNLALPAFTNWLNGLEVAKAGEEPAVHLAGELLRVPLTEGEGTNVAGWVTGQTASFQSSGPLLWETNGPLGPAPVLSKRSSLLLGDLANFEWNTAFSCGAWVKIPENFKGEGSILARMAGEDGKHRGWDFYVREQSFGTHQAHRWANMAMAVKANDKSIKGGEWQHVFMTSEGTGRASGVKLFVNGLEVEANRDQNGLEGSITNHLPLRLGRRERGNELEGVAVQDVRLYSRRLSASEVRALAAGPRLPSLMADRQRAPTNAAPAEALRDYFLVTHDAGWQESAARLARLEAEQQSIRGRSPVTLVQEEKKDSEPTAQVLFRGQYDKPKEKVSAGTPAVLPPMPEGAPRNRLGLAQWLVSRDHPLTARVVVNRFWQEIFGVGLVKTAEDFGATGDAPSHPDLLDWLAVEFQESGWDVKHMFELMVTSSTYRQSAEASAEKLEKDSANRLLSRGPRFRMDAEMVRDYALAASGLLVQKVGGPSVKPYQPPGVWEAVAMPESNTREYAPDRDEGLYRRSLYTFWKRAAPPALLDLFNAPSRETCAVRRERTDTPLQALATLNDPQFVQAARHLAALAWQEGHGRIQPALAIMAERLLARPLTAKERAIVENTLGEMQRFYQQQPEAARRLLATGEAPVPPEIPAPTLAALTLVANQLLNLDEVLNK
jgi:hypothetical protein